MYIDYKTTVWGRIEVKPHQEELVLQLLEEGLDIDSVYGKVEDLEGSILDPNSEELMTIKDNEGNSTIELYKDSNLIWENGKGE